MSAEAKCRATNNFYLFVRTINVLIQDMARGFQELLDYEGDVQEDFGVTFQMTYDDLGVIRTVPLKSGGEKVPVTNQNRREYVRACVNYMLNKSVYR